MSKNLNTNVSAHKTSTKVSLTNSTIICWWSHLLGVQCLYSKCLVPWSNRVWRAEINHNTHLPCKWQQFLYATIYLSLRVKCVSGFYFFFLSNTHFDYCTFYLARQDAANSRPSQFHQIISMQAPFFFELITSLPAIDKTLSDYTDCAAAALRAFSAISRGHICDNLFSSSQTLFLLTNSLKTAAEMD